MEKNVTTTKQVKFELLQGTNNLVFVKTKLRIGKGVKDVLAMVDGGCSDTMIEVGLLPDEARDLLAKYTDEYTYGSFNEANVRCRMSKVAGAIWLPQGDIYYQGMATDLSAIRDMARRSTPTKRGNVRMVIGGDFLLAYRCTLDYDRMEMTLNVPVAVNGDMDGKTEGEEGKA